MSETPSSHLLSSFGWQQRFEVLEKIGAGAMGQVWRAREIGHCGRKPVDDAREHPGHLLAEEATVIPERIVALKLLDPARSGDEQTLARLEIEGETLTRLREAGAHENVVPILDFKITEEHACLVMEYVPGLNLKNWCSTYQSSLTERVKLIAQVARAAGWFHGLGVVHRDLKPTNILVHAITHQPIIVDFSIAKQDAALTLTLTNEALGTAPYMAPEQIDRARGDIAPATDVYALGATLYELLTQVHPHPGDFTQVVRRHAEEVRPASPSALNPEVPRDLECLILKALSHRPADRYADGIALADDLDRFLAGEPVKARPLPLVTRVLRRARRKPALTAALAACVVLGGMVLWNGQRQAAQRERFILESRLTSAMQQEIWNERSLADAEATLSSLVQHDPDLATTLRQRLQQDVVHDMEARLQQNHLRDDDFTWLQSTAEWLKPRLPEQAGHLQSLITERAGRWETQAELRPPFADKQGLFPRSHVGVVKGLLHSLHTEPNKTPGIVITDAISVPMEIECTFVASGATFHHIALGFLHANAVIELALYKAKHTSVRRSISSTEIDPESYILYLIQNGEYKHGLHLPDTQLLEQPFRLTLRLERERAEATLNGSSSLRLDSPFALGSVQPHNFCRISWPADVGLQHLALRTRRADAVSPLEEADLLATQGQWAAARRRYENLRGDPQFGSEADCKIAQCLWREGEKAAACAQWEKFIPKPSSPWRDRSLLHLSMHSLLGQEWTAASRYLHLLPEHLSPSLLRQLDSQLNIALSDLLVTTSLGIVKPRTDRAAITAITQAFQFLQTPPLHLANRLGMPHHFARQDVQARALYATGLLAKASPLSDPESLIAATNCLDQWCRLGPSENDNQLTAALERWKGTPNGQAIRHMEQARVVARAGNLRKAIASIRQAREKPEKLDTRLHTGLWLLEGMLYRIQKDEAKAQLAWQKGRQIAATVTQRHPLHLFDSVLLHSLTQSWNPQTTGDVLTTLASRHLPKEDRPAAQAAFDAVFLTDPAWIATFNAVLQSGAGRIFAEDYVLCREPPREFFQRFYRLLFEHYFLVAAPDQTTRIRQIADSLVTEMTINPQGEISHLYAYLRAWNDPAAVKSLYESSYPYSPALIESMQWLLQQRHP
ncbi:MAG: serine/threonine protein kinase [Verrucomicrobiaceae bacterium]|nr:serine/threonine protein kinase [Verrucomicrobiaceae bacterium]